MIKPNSTILSKSGMVLGERKNSRFQFLKDNLSKASNSLKNKFEKIFSFNRGENFEKELVDYEKNQFEPNEDDYENDDNDEEIEIYEEESPNKNKLYAYQRVKYPNEEENYIYLAENGDLHYVDIEGNTFKCREENGDLILEERVVDNSEYLNKINKKCDKNIKNESKKLSKQISKEEDEHEKPDLSLKEDKCNYLANENGNFIEIEKTEVVFEEFVFSRNEEEYEFQNKKCKNYTQVDKKLQRIHKLRDKKEIIEFNRDHLFKVTKPNQKSMKLIQLIKTKVTRYIGIDETILYVMSRDKENYKVRSATNILSIRKILINKDNDKILKIEISDLNKIGEDVSLKIFDFEKRNDFLITLKSIFRHIGLELNIILFH